MRSSLVQFQPSVLVPPWCSGSTTDFGSVSPGSTPGGGSEMNPIRHSIVRGDFMHGKNFKPWRETLNEILKNMSPQEREEFDANVLMRRQVLEEKIRQYNAHHHGQEIDESDSV